MPLIFLCLFIFKVSGSDPVDRIVKATATGATIGALMGGVQEAWEDKPVQVSG
jgi:hypothetical protein